MATPKRLKKCCVPECTDAQSKRHRFPKKYPDIFNKWLERIQPPNYQMLSKDEQYQKFLVCEAHFLPDDIVPGYRGLKVTAVPCLNVPDRAPLISSSTPCASNIVVKTEPDDTKNWNYAESTEYHETMRKKLCEIPDTINKRKQYNTPVERVPSSVPVVKKEIDRRCRVCLLKTENGLPLSYTTNIKGEESLTLSEIMNKFCNIQVFFDDSRPQLICISCAEGARAVYEFCIRCKKTESILQAEKKGIGCSTTTIKRNACELKRIDNTSKHSPNVLKRDPLKSKERLSCNNEKLSSKKTTTKTQATNTITRKTKQYPRILNKCKRCNFHKRKLNRKSTERGMGLERKQTVVCLRCYKNFKKQYEFYLYHGVFIRKKVHRCVKCEARFANIKKLNFHTGIHKNENYKTSKKK